MQKYLSFLALLFLVALGHYFVNIDGVAVEKHESFGGFEEKASSINDGVKVVSTYSKRQLPPGAFFGPPPFDSGPFMGPSFGGPGFGGPFGPFQQQPPLMRPIIISGSDSPRTFPGLKGWNFGFEKFSFARITSSFSKDYLAYILGKSNERNREEDRKYWNKLRPKSLADTFESVVGSYLVYHSEFEAILAIEWLGLKIFDEHTFSEMHEQAVVFSRLPTALIEGDRSDVQQFYNASKSKVRRLQEILDYKFKDPSYLVQAITHASALQKCTRSYERLEFLGDAILDYLVTMTLAKEANISDPGQMTSSRSALVNNCAFAKFAMRYKFDLFIQHGSAEIYDELIKVRNSMDEDPDMVFFDIVDFDKIVKLLGDVFESVAGAIYLDSGCSLNSVWSVYYPMMKEAIDAEIRHPTQNLTQLLHETFPGKGRIEYESYDIRTEDGDFVCVKCKIVGFGEFEGQGMSKSEAKKRAVRAAMDNAPSPEMKATLDREFIAKYSKTNDRARGNNRGRSRGGRRGGYRGGHSRTRDLRPRL